MRNKKFDWRKYAPYAVIILLFAVAGLFSGGFLSAGGVGATPISVQQIEAQSQNSRLNGSVIHMLSVADLSSRYSVGSMSVEEAEGSGVYIESPFTITDEIKNYVCQLKVRNTSVFSVNTYTIYRTGTYRKYSQGGCPSVPSGCRLDTRRDESFGCTTFYYCARASSKLGDLSTLNTQSKTIYEVEHKITVGDKSSSITLTPANRIGQSEFLYAGLTGNLAGWVDCPVAAASFRVWRPVNTNNFQLKDESIAQSVNTDCSNVNSVDAAERCNAAISNMLSNQVTDAFSDCENPVFNGTEASLSCTPTELPALPVIETFIKADWIGLVVPVGEPEIVSVETSPCDAAGTCRALVTARNIGRFSDSFDFAIQGLTQTSIREPFEAGEEKIVEIPYSAVGMIKKFNFTMTSVNDPTKKSVKEETITIYPFCDRNPTSPNQERMMTEFGCFYTCGNKTYEKNIAEEDCSEFPPYPIDSEAATDLVTQNGYTRHCIGVGEYVVARQYLLNSITFIPEYREHQVWLPAPYCKYVMEYGFAKIDGQVMQITDGLTFYNRVTGEGREITEEEEIEPTPTEETPTPDTSTVDNPTSEPPISTTTLETEEVQPEGINWTYVGGAMVGLAAISFGVWHFFFRKKH